MSSATKPFSDEELQELLAKSRKNNVINGITGLLLYIDKDFLQVLEGEKDDVLKLYHKIEKDGRNSSVIPVFRCDVEERQFASWDMGFSKTSYSVLKQDSQFEKISKATLVNIEDKTAIIFIDSFVNSHKIEVIYT